MFSDSIAARQSPRKTGRAVDSVQYIPYTPAISVAGSFPACRNHSLSGQDPV
ncbi:hypothetical protein Z945_3886 [Sulfitobacter noctilucae]|nr:hypothetical protein Z945_3886 [Sulfitobacter noctilucae]